MFPVGLPVRWITFDDDNNRHEYAGQVAAIPDEHSTVREIVFFDADDEEPAWKTVDDAQPFNPLAPQYADYYEAV